MRSTKNESEDDKIPEWPSPIGDSGKISCVGNQLLEVLAKLREQGKFAESLTRRLNANYVVRYITLGITTDEKTVDAQKMLL